MISSTPVVIIDYLSGKEEYLHAYDELVVLIVHILLTIIGHGVRRVQVPMERIMDHMFDLRNTPLELFAAPNVEKVWISIIQCRAVQLSQLVRVK